MDVQSPKAPSWFCLRLDVYPPPQVLQTDGCIFHLTLASLVVRVLHTVGPLRSTGITPFLRYCWPLRHPLAVHRLPAVIGYTVSCSADFSTGRGGLLQLLKVSLSSCCR